MIIFLITSGYGRQTNTIFITKEEYLNSEYLTKEITFPVGGVTSIVTSKIYKYDDNYIGLSNDKSYWIYGVNL